MNFLLYHVCLSFDLPLCLFYSLVVDPQSICRPVASSIPSRGIYLIYSVCSSNYTDPRTSALPHSWTTTESCVIRRPEGPSMEPPLMIRTGRTRKLLCVSHFSHQKSDLLSNLLSHIAAGYSFFDSGEVALLGRKKKSPFSNVGQCLGHLCKTERLLTHLDGYRKGDSSCGILNRWKSCRSMESSLSCSTSVCTYTSVSLFVLVKALRVVSVTVSLIVCLLLSNKFRVDLYYTSNRSHLSLTCASK